jgi:hypothetical protein
MPPYDRVGLHDDQGGAPLPPPFGEENPKEAVPHAELWAVDSARQYGQLLTKREIFERDCPVSAADQFHRTEEYKQRRQHA